MCPNVEGFIVQFEQAFEEVSPFVVMYSISFDEIVILEPFRSMFYFGDLCMRLVINCLGI